MVTSWVPDGQLHNFTGGRMVATASAMSLSDHSFSAGVSTVCPGR